MHKSKHRPVAGCLKEEIPMATPSDCRECSCKGCKHEAEIAVKHNEREIM